LKHLSVNLRRQLRELRLRAGLSQRQLGEKIGLTNAAVSMIEGGSRDTGTSNVEAWAEICGGTLQVVSPTEETISVGHLSSADRQLLAELVATMPTLEPAHMVTLRTLVTVWATVSP
jgi:transcriptional regulator with XRE-family HTH domain